MANHHEDADQSTVFDWAGYHRELRWLHAIPNGGSRKPLEAVRLKRQGVKAGVSDMFLPVPRNGFHGLYIEMKRDKRHGPSRVSPDQKEFHTDMLANGYACEVCYGAEEAINTIKQYMGMK